VRQGPQNSYSVSQTNRYANVDQNEIAKDLILPKAEAGQNQIAPNTKPSPVSETEEVPLATLIERKKGLVETGEG
jgi:hypothetical protein